MQNLTDFKPLERVTLPGLGELETSGLILVVGPNSSGKTQFLHDVHYRIRGEPRTLVVAEEIVLRKPEDLNAFIDCLQREGYLTKFMDDSGAEHLRPLTTFVGTGEAAPQITLNQPQQWFQSYTVDDVGRIRRRIEFLGYFGRLLVTALFLERRLVSVNQTGMFDFQAQPPQNDLHALYVDDAAKNALLAEVQSTFSKSVWPDASRGTTLCLRVSDEPELPSPEQRLSPRIMSQYRTIETEGDGLKSYVATCIALLLGRRPVCVVDEPEMCLHPPQAYNLGRFIGRFGAVPERVTFVATHSSHVLRGVIQTATKLQIVRLTRQKHAFVAHKVPSTVLTEVLTRPTVRAETVLDGVFAEAVVVLEADGDRTVYQAVYETLADEFHRDIHFTAVGGTGGIADTCRLYRTLRIPVAVIADLDLLVDTDRLERVLSQLTDDVNLAKLVAQATSVSTAIKNLPPTVSPADVKTQLSEIANSNMDWATNDDTRVRSALRSLAQQVDRMKRLKRGGVRALPPDLQSGASSLLTSLADVGLFLVPVGELEEWLAAHGIKASKQNKWAWANEAAMTVRRLGAQEGDVWSFMRSIAGHLSHALGDGASR